MRVAVSWSKILINVSAPRNLTQPVSPKAYLDHRSTHYLFANFELEFLFCLLMFPGAIVDCTVRCRINFAQYKKIKNLIPSYYFFGSGVLPVLEA